jgi:hypothetical protein
MKTLFLICALLITMNLSFSKETKSFLGTSILKEGIQRTFTKAQIDFIKPWASNSKIKLENLIEDIENLDLDNKINLLYTGIKEIVVESAPKNTELLMRYVLNRGRVVFETIDAETNNDGIGTKHLKLRVLVRSVEMALEYYSNDYQFLTKKDFTPIAFAKFGADYAMFMNEINNSVFDVSAQYKIAKYCLGWFAWDLFRDQSLQVHSPTIDAINLKLENLSKFDSNLSDKKTLPLVRLLKKYVSKYIINNSNLIGYKYRQDSIKNQRSLKIHGNRVRFSVGDHVVIDSPKSGYPVKKVDRVIKTGPGKYKYDLGSYYGIRNPEELLPHKVEGSPYRVGQVVVLNLSGYPSKTIKRVVQKRNGQFVYYLGSYYGWYTDSSFFEEVN